MSRQHFGYRALPAPNLTNSLPQLFFQRGAVFHSRMGTLINRAKLLPAYFN